jgi:glycosyltransferase involved in cell wall biosynthesis
VATAVGGVPENVEDGVNGLLVPPTDADALAAALRRALAERDRLATSAATSVERFSEERVYGRLEEILAG